LRLEKSERRIGHDQASSNAGIAVLNLATAGGQKKAKKRLHKRQGTLYKCRP